MDRKRVFHITDPWMTTERCLVSVGPPKDSRRGETVVYGMGCLRRSPPTRPVRTRSTKTAAAIHSLCAGERRRWCVQSFGALLLHRPAACETVDFQRRCTAQFTLGSPDRLDLRRRWRGRRAARGGGPHGGRWSYHTAFRKKYAMYFGRPSEIVDQLIDGEHWSQALMWGTAGSIAALGVLFWQMLRLRRARHGREG